MFQSLSEFRDAIIDQLTLKLSDDIKVFKYSEFSEQDLYVNVFVEVESYKRNGRHNDGRQAYLVNIALHCVVSNKRDNSESESLDLSTAINPLIDNASWGCSDDVDFPSDTDTYPGMFKQGDNGYESWVIGFKQNVYIGPALIEKEASFEMKALKIAVNPVDPDDKEEYQSLSIYLA